MARLPYLSPTQNRSMRVQAQFLGLNQQLVVNTGEFADQLNASSRYFPAIAARRPRGTTQTTLTNPNGLIYKNHLFWVDGTKCYYNGTQISGLTVTNGKKQLVGMGAYICIFPDKKVYNTHTGEILQIDASYTQSGTITFQEVSTDSAFTKITATGIQNTFKQYDGVKIDGVSDDTFKLDGDGVTKVITETGTNYIIVTAPIQKSYVGAATIGQITISGNVKTRINATGIGSNFKVNDRVKIIGCNDDGLNVDNKTVLAKSTNYIDIDFTIPSRTYTQGSTVMTFQPYYTGSDLTKISATNLNTIFHEGDVVNIQGCSNSKYNGAKTIMGAGTDYILVEVTLDTTFTQASGITISRGSAKYDSITVKRTAFTQASGITFKRKSQDFDYVCELDNRLWACSSENHEIYASKLGDPTNWNCFEGTATDSYAVTLGSDGVFTGCVSHLGHVIFFKENTIHMMYGDKPANFALKTSELPGVREGCADSIEIVEETLYYVGRNGVYSFDGAIPFKISDNIVEEVSDAIVTQEDGKLYMSCKLGGNQTLLTYDPKLKIWNKEDDTVFKFSCYGEGHGYYIDANNKLMTVTGSDTEVIEWMLESGDIKEDSILTKYVSKLMFNFWLTKGTVATIYIKCDDSPMWVRKGTITASSDSTYTLPITPQRCEKYRYRIKFRGDGKLLSSSRTVEGGTELNGKVRYGYRQAGH